MKIENRIQNDVVIIYISGRIDPSVTALFEQEVGRAMATPQSCVLLNLKDVDYVSSSGLRVFLTALKKTKAENRQLKVCCLNSNIFKIFQIAGFTQLFDITQTEEEALARLTV